MTAAAPARVRDPPRGWRRAAWLGPGFLWLVSAAGSGELLFTPRIGALYGYAFVWALLATVLLKWLINREAGRYAVCTGRALMTGFSRLPGPHGWAVWVILVPQLVVAVATIAGLASGAATAVILVAPGPLALWTGVSIAAAAALVAWGRYRALERAAAALALALAVAAVAAATTVAPSPARVASGLAPRWPAGAAPGEVLPWLGFMLSGAAGLVWYSYWIRAKGYGLAPREGRDPPDPATLSRADQERLRGWIRQMTLDNTVAVGGVLVITLAFLVLGTELLRPAGLVPEEARVAEVLGRLLGGVWGPVGFWFMVLGIFVGFWSTVLSDQDGYGRMFADGTRRLLPERLRRRPWADERRLARGFVLVLVAALPFLLFLVVGEPVRLLQVAGAIEAAHIPLVAWLTVLLNRRELPARLRPSRATSALVALAGLFFAAFAAFYLWTLARGAAAA